MDILKSAARSKSLQLRFSLRWTFSTSLWASNWAWNGRDWGGSWMDKSGIKSPEVKERRDRRSDFPLFTSLTSPGWNSIPCDGSQNFLRSTRKKQFCAGRQQCPSLPLPGESKYPNGIIQIPILSSPFPPNRFPIALPHGNNLFPQVPVPFWLLMTPRSASR